MKEITISGEIYKLEYGFEAAECRDLIQMLFETMTGAYVIKRAKNVEKPTSEEVIDGSGRMVAEMPHICKTAFYAGLLENHEGVTQDMAKTLMKAYMKENNLSFHNLYEEIKQCIEDDGFLKLSGLEDMMKQERPKAKKK